MGRGNRIERQQRAYRFTEHRWTYRCGKEQRFRSYQEGGLDTVRSNIDLVNPNMAMELDNENSR